MMPLGPALEQLHLCCDRRILCGVEGARTLVQGPCSDTPALLFCMNAFDVCVSTETRHFGTARLARGSVIRRVRVIVGGTGSGSLCQGICRSRLSVVLPWGSGNAMTVVKLCFENAWCTIVASGVLAAAYISSSEPSTSSSGKSPVSTLSGRTNAPYDIGHSKMRCPFTEPSFLPTGSSN